MKVRIVTKAVRDLTPSEFRECEKATYVGQGSYGLMHGQLHQSRRSRSRQHRAILCYNTSNQLVGWALSFPSNGFQEVYLYVHKSVRRRGIGTKLLGRARMGRKAPIGVNNHNQVATAFFNSAISKGRAMDVF